MSKFLSLLTLVLLTICSMQSCDASQNLQHMNYPDYPELWKQYDKVMNDGKFEDGRAILKQIETQAIKDKNDPQLIKVAYSFSNILEATEEDAQIKSIKLLESYMPSLSIVGKSVAQSLLASQYQRYYNFNQYKINQLTETEDKPSENISLWTSRTFLEKISALYFASVQDLSSQKQGIESYQAIIEKLNGDGGELRPTVYDMLAHRAIDYFAQSRSMVTTPINEFVFDKPQAFAATKEFIAYDFLGDADSESSLYSAIKILQELEQFRQNDKNILANILAKRLLFAHTHTVNPDKDQLYLNSLEEAINKFRSEPQSAYLLYNLAKLHENQASRYQYGKEKKYAGYYQKAISLYRSGIETYDDPQVKKTFETAISMIEHSSFNSQVLQVNAVSMPSLMKIEYKNVKLLNIEIRKLTFEDLKKYYISNLKNQRSIVKNGEKITSWNQELPAYDDYQFHSTEISIPSLEQGFYAVILKSAEEEKFSITQLSNLSFTTGAHVYVINRNTGAPIENATVDVYQQEYSGRNRNLVKTNSKETDKRGMSMIEVNNRSVMYHIKTKNDELFLNEHIYFGGKPRKEIQKPSLNIFTDRSIYRPSQEVFFKLIAYQSNIAEDPKVLANKTITISLRDVNYQELSKQEFKTNEYGSAHGSFILPSKGLNGMHHLVVSLEGQSFSQSIQVEEYKRPKFEVVMDTITDAVKFDDLIEATGTAKNYSGQAVDNATVAYQVTREEYYRYYRWYGFPRSSKKILTHGKIRTDKQGKFTIKFLAEPDKSIFEGEKRTYHYRIQVDITDASGETRSTSQSIKVSNQSAFLHAEEDYKFDVSEKEPAIDVAIKNIFDKDLSQTIDYKIESLALNTRIKRKKLWSFPQTHVMSEEDYAMKHPLDIYQEEDQWKNNPVTKTIKRGKLEPDQEKKIDLSNLTYGLYKLTMTAQGAEDRISYIQMNHVKKKMINPTFVWEVKTVENSYQPGQKAKIQIVTPHKDLQVYYIINRIGLETSYNNVQINASGIIEIPVTKADRGGISVTLFTTKDERYHTEHVMINVPWKELDLNISWESFRSDLYPGSEEKWRLKILDADNKPVNAELLTSMYDASLDQFKPHAWEKFRLPQMYRQARISSHGFRLQYAEYLKNRNYINHENLPHIVYPKFKFDQVGRLVGIRGSRSKNMAATSSGAKPGSAPMMDQNAEVAYESIDEEEGNANDTMAPPQTVESGPPSKVDPPNIRTNLNETVFFYPEMKTNESGEVFVEFTMNEALTEWKLQTFAHDKNLKHALNTKEVKTKKDLMVFPNGPRFFREGDQVSILSKVVNMTQQPMDGVAEIKILDTYSQKDVTNIYLNEKNKKSFQISASESQSISWLLDIPFGKSNSLSYQITASSGQHMDGEENTAIVLTNRSLITESLPINIQANSNKHIDFQSLANLDQSSTAEAQLLKFSFTSNPSWLAVQSLPYLMEFPHKCSEQIFSRFFANSLGAHILKLNPGIEKTYSEWRDKDQLISALRKNEELKSAVLSETPWVMDALSEEEQMERMATLFDMARIQSESEDVIQTLKERQNGGGLPWFPGGRPNWYITQYILEGMGQLNKLGVIDIRSAELSSFIEQAVAFIDAEFLEHYARDKKHQLTLSPIVIHYLYTRSFYSYINTDIVDIEMNQYKRLAKKNWLDVNIFNQGHLAVIFSRDEDVQMANKIIESLRQRAIKSEELGMYWKETNGYFWHESAIEKQSMLISAFSELDAPKDEIDQMKTWLLRNKQTNSWKSTKATTQAVYALIEHGSKWIAETQTITLKIQDKPIVFEQEATAGIGYVEKSFHQDEISTSQSKFQVDNTNDHMAWGSVSLQYWEDNDRVKSYQETPLKLIRTYYKKVRTDRGETLTEIKDGNQLNTGDVLTVKIQLEVDRPMEFIHMKDMRASGTEPTQVVSAYKYKGGLSYYMETKDVATNFFIDYLPRGKYTIEYDQRVVQPGQYSCGFTTVQSMYAPEFGANSDGLRITIIE